MSALARGTPPVPPVSAAACVRACDQGARCELLARGGGDGAQSLLPGPRQGRLLRLPAAPVPGGERPSEEM
eukprot:8816531-Pyramimonas_sp.AAC.1